ncbi:hypothetical protein EAG_03708 [Camponotus floridanus]|uniref:Uncharacterized protein n=1 Tax=Camponotus floridanus TaxID=104421 RepID=E2AVR4_CAMFO|nr:hypothetical protein EAG_03708 [Camponotus floridanus]
MYTVFNKCSILVKNIKLKQKFGLLTTRVDVNKCSILVKNIKLKQKFGLLPTRVDVKKLLLKKKRKKNGVIAFLGSMNDIFLCASNTERIFGIPSVIREVAGSYGVSSAAHLTVPVPVTSVTVIRASTFQHPYPLTRTLLKKALAHFFGINILYAVKPALFDAVLLTKCENWAKLGPSNEYIISLYIRKYITSLPQALNFIEYILNFSKCSILVENMKSKQKFGLLTTRVDVKRTRCYTEEDLHEMGEQAFEKVIS